VALALAKGFRMRMLSKVKLGMRKVNNAQNNSLIFSIHP
jgi:hypothetical protein